MDLSWPCWRFRFSAPAKHRQSKRFPPARRAPCRDRICSVSTVPCVTEIDGKGTGPDAGALKTKPADLTLVSRKNGGKYPEIRVQRVINGEDDVMAHGSRDMPVWGQIFRHMSSNQDLGSVRIYNLVKYIEQVQAK